MRRFILVGLLLPILMFTDCGDKPLILEIDLLSYIDPEFQSVEYGPIATGTPTTNLDIIDEEINLLEGIDDITQVESAKVKVAAAFDNATGTATWRLRVYVVPTEISDPFAETPIVDISGSLQAGQTTNVSDEVSTTPDLIEVLTQDEARYAVRITFNTVGSPEAVRGTVTLTQLLAIITTKQDL